MNMNREKKIAIAIVAIIFVVCIVQAVQIGLLMGSNKKLTTQVSQLESDLVTTSENVSQVQTKIETSETPTLYLPKDMYVSAGITMEIYNDEITWGVNPDDYIYYWSCDIGDCMENKFHYGGMDADVGPHVLKVKVYDYQKNEVASAETILHVGANEFLSQKLTGLNVLTIGDSLTSDAAWLSYIRDLSLAKINNIGTLGATPGLQHEGRLGFSAMNYLEGIPYDIDAKKVYINPKTGKFDWTYYKKTNKMNPDVVQIFLGANGMSVDPTDNVKAITEIVEIIHTADPTIPILVVQTIYPSGQDGMAKQQNVLGFQAFHGMWSFERDEMTFNLMTALDEAFSEMDQVYLVPAAITFDREHNFNYAATKVNPHSLQETIMSVESIHPSAEGAKQIGDTMYSILSYLVGKEEIGTRTTISANAVSANAVQTQ